MINIYRIVYICNGDFVLKRFFYNCLLIIEYFYIVLRFSCRIESENVFRGKFCFKYVMLV